MPDPVDNVGDAASARAEQLARVALIIACVAMALAVLGLFLPI
jgi:hypothetical protein